MKRMTELLILLLFCLVPGLLVMADTIAECAPAHEDMDKPSIFIIRPWSGAASLAARMYG